jgi:hypothetical protein
VTSERFVAFLVRHGRWVLLALVLLALPASYRTVVTYSNLRSDLEELLPSSAPSVRALEQARQRLPGLRHLGVVVDTGDPKNVPAALRFISDLEARVAAYPEHLAAAVRSGVAAERRFLETYALQFIEPQDIRALTDAVVARHRWEVGRATGLSLLDETEDPAPEIPLRELQEKYAGRLGGTVSLPDDRFVSADGSTAVLVIQSGSKRTSIEADEELLSKVQSDISGLGFPEAYAPGMRVGFAGDVATRVEEARGLALDLGVSGVVVWLLVMAVITWFYRTFAAVPVLSVPVLLGTLFTFGLVALPPFSIQQLNSNTAFLSSILVGNGINAGVILLARFQEQIARGDRVLAALSIAVRETYRPTFAASLAAAAAYSSLALTDFRGFSQFGWIGALGMLVTWGVTYLVVPIVTYRFQARFAKDVRRSVLAPRFADTVLRHPRAVLGIAGVCLMLATIGIASRYGGWIETDFSRLRRADSWVSGERYWGKRMDQTLQRYLTPTVIMTSSPEQAEQVAAAVRSLIERHEAGDMIASVRSAADVLPPQRHASLDEAKRLASALTPAMLQRLEPQDRARLERMLSPAALRPITAADLPAVLTAGLRDTGGHIDRNVLVFPRVGAHTWDAGHIEAYAHDLRAVAEAAGPGVIATGPLLLSNDMIDAMRSDGPRASAAALLAVLAVVWFAFRSVSLSALAVTTLIAGFVVMLGVGAWAGQRLNFSNFVALPLTFGIAADYSINVLKRYQSDGDLRAAISDTGGAVALCSATTVIGFGSLLLANNQALFSFGALAVTGELTGLITAALVLPAFLVWRGARSRPVFGPDAAGVGSRA